MRKNGRTVALGQKKENYKLCVIEIQVTQFLEIKNVEKYHSQQIEINIPSLIYSNNYLSYR